MEKNFSCYLHLIGCGALALVPSVPTDGISFDELIRYAREQKTEPLLFVALKKGRRVGASTALVPIERETFGTIARMSVRRAAVCELFRKAKERGLHPILVKGMAVAAAYDSPVLRYSSDTDILISEKEEESMAQLLLESGVCIEPRTDRDHHGVYRCERIGIVELHTELIDERVYRLWLDRDSVLCREPLPSMPLREEEGEVTVLCPTEQYLHLCLHALFHLTSKGIGAQMCVDLAAYARAYRDEIDFSLVREELERVNGMRFIRACFALLKGAGLPVTLPAGFSEGADEPEEAKAIGEAAELLALDISAGGRLGKEEEAVRSSAKRRQDNERAKERGEGVGFRLRDTAVLLRRRLIPDRETLKTKYPDRGRASATVAFIKENLRDHRRAEKKRGREDEVYARREKLFRVLGLIGGREAGDRTRQTETIEKTEDTTDER